MHLVCKKEIHSRFFLRHARNVVTTTALRRKTKKYAYALDSSQNYENHQRETAMSPNSRYNTTMQYNSNVIDSDMDIFFDKSIGHQISGSINENTCDDFVDMTIEPTPIDTRRMTFSYTSIQSLPQDITKYCNEYIQVLSKIDGEAPGKDFSKTNSRLATCVSPSLLQEISSTSDDSSTHSNSHHAFQNERWMDRYHELIIFHKEEGHFNVPNKTNSTLFQWVKRQRHQYKLSKLGERSNLTQERIALLDGIGFVWNSHLAAWNDKFKELEQFKADNGHCFVPCNYKGSSKLSTWIKRQRRQYRKFVAKQQSTLDAKRISKLERLGLAWDYYGGHKDATKLVSSDEE